MSDFITALRDGIIFIIFLFIDLLACKYSLALGIVFFILTFMNVYMYWECQEVDIALEVYKERKKDE